MKKIIKGKSAGPMADDVFHTYMESMKAADRLMDQQGVYGGAKPCAMTWLLRFAQEDLANLDTGGQSDRWEEVKRFAFDAGIEETLEAPPLTNIEGVEYVFHNTTTPLDLLRGIQTAVQDSLKPYLAGASLAIDHLNISFKLESPSSERPRPRVMAHMHDVQAAVLYQMLYLVAEFGPRIRTCKGCDRLFLAGRTDKTYCEGLCQAKKYKRDHPSPVKKRTQRTYSMKGRRDGKKIRRRG